MSKYLIIVHVIAKYNRGDLTEGWCTHSSHEYFVDEITPEILESLKVKAVERVGYGYAVIHQIVPQN